VTDDQPLPAGRFSDWLVDMQQALRRERDAEVPCGGCTACCTSSQFVHIEPDETETLALIPRELLVPAPGSPRGHLVLGYDDNGHCPMLIDDKCSIYEHRPRTCRTYDCRVFAASGVEIHDEHQVAIARRARRWVFDFPADVDRVQRDAVRAAGRSLEDGNATERAVRAIELHKAFLASDD
jgi:Fe-S-cluster containining protein